MKPQQETLQIRIAEILLQAYKRKPMGVLNWTWEILGYVSAIPENKPRAEQPHCRAAWTGVVLWGSITGSTRQWSSTDWSYPETIRLQGAYLLAWQVWREEGSTLSFPLSHWSQFCNPVFESSHFTTLCSLVLFPEAVAFLCPCCSLGSPVHLNKAGLPCPGMWGRGKREGRWLWSLP